MAIIDRLADRSTAVTSDLYADVLPMLDDILTRLVLITKDAFFFKTLEVGSGLKAVSVIRFGMRPVSIIRGGLKAVSIIRGEWCSLLSSFIS